MPKGVYKRKPNQGYGRYERTPEIRKRLAEVAKGNKAHWKGEKAGYWARHRWLDAHYGRPKECEFCGKIDDVRYEWANISGEYRRKREDYYRLCRPCHIAFDKGKSIKSKIGTFNDYNRYSSKARSKKRKMG